MHIIQLLEAQHLSTTASCCCTLLLRPREQKFCFQSGHTAVGPVGPALGTCFMSVSPYFYRCFYIILLMFSELFVVNIRYKLFQSSSIFSILNFWLCPFAWDLQLYITLAGIKKNWTKTTPRGISIGGVESTPPRGRGNLNRPWLLGLIVKKFPGTFCLLSLSAVWAEFLFKVYIICMQQSSNVLLLKILKEEGPNDQTHKPTQFEGLDDWLLIWQCYWEPVTHSALLCKDRA